MGLRNRAFAFRDVLGAIFVFAGLILCVVLIRNAQPKMGYPPTLSYPKQLALASLMYANDNDGKLMPRDSWMDATFPYSRTWSIYHRPTVNETGLDRDTVFGYAFNSTLECKDLNRVAEPERVPMIYDSINLAKNASDPVLSLPQGAAYASGSKRVNQVAFVDGHGGFLKPGQRMGP